MRSLRSALVEKLIRLSGMKKRYVDKATLEKYINKKKQKQKKYTIPRIIKLKYGINYKQFKNMDCYVYPGSKKCILYLHGGAYIDQPSIFHWIFLNKIHKKTGATVIVPIYPKLPNNTYKNSFDKVFPLYQEIIKHYDSESVYLMGDSAGGGFALALAQLLLDENVPQPSDIILLSPWLDIKLDNPKITKKLEKADPMIAVNGAAKLGKLYAGNTERESYLLSPINGKLIGLADLTLFVGTREILLPDARKFNIKARNKGISIQYHEFSGMNHVFPLFPIPEAKIARKIIIDTINK